ncbi:MAG: tetratricopeptide repeat protein [Gemmatimonadota bacterium]
MSTVNVVRLDDYRDRRCQRSRLAQCLQGAVREKRSLIQALAAVTEVMGADRAALVWIDEYGPGLVHPHVVLDLISDRPRRAFPVEVFRKAWEAGVPGLYETGTAAWGRLRGPDAPGWGMAVALGSDGTRAWFMVADAVGSRPSLTPEQRGQVMFLAGECTGIVLHRDLDSGTGGGVPSGTKGGHAAVPRFAGWHILQDLEGREDGDEDGKRIALRFIVARLPRLLAEEDFAVAEDRRREQVAHALGELEADGGEYGREGILWRRVLDAYARGDLAVLARALVDLGEEVEALGHYFGATELHRTAYEVAVAEGDVACGIDAARSAGRALRRQAQWDDANHWYNLALQVADAAGMEAGAALAMSGLAIIHRERGNLPAARGVLTRGLERAQKSGSALALGRIHHDFMSLDHAAGRLPAALEHGWTAVQRYEGGADRTRALAGLAGVLESMGDLDAAEDAWTLVAHLTDETYYRFYALDALAYLSALRGEKARFARFAAEADLLDRSVGSRFARAEKLLYRALSYRALGMINEARRWARKARTYAAEHDFHQIAHRAEETLESLDTSPATPGPLPDPAPETGSGAKSSSSSPSASSGAVRRVKSELHAMRVDVVGVSS